MNSKITKVVWLSILVSTLLIFSGCAGSGGGEYVSDNPYDASISFTMKVQAGDYSGATNLLTWEEQNALLASNGDVKAEYKAGMRAIKVSAMQGKDLTLDKKGKLVGMLAVIEEYTRKSQISDESRNLDLKKIEAKYAAERKAKADSIAEAKKAESAAETEENAAEGGDEKISDASEDEDSSAEEEMTEKEKSESMETAETEESDEDFPEASETEESDEDFPEAIEDEDGETSLDEDDQSSATDDSDFPEADEG